MPAEAADRAAIAIILHMQPDVTLDDGVEAVLLDRATALDVRGDGYELVDGVRPQASWRRSREGLRSPVPSPRSGARSRSGPTCQSARLLHRTGLADWMARSPWMTSDAGGG